MLHSQLLVTAYHSFTSALLFVFPVLIILVSVLYFFKIQEIKRRKRLILKDLRELAGSGDADKHLPSSEILSRAEGRFTSLKGQAKIDPKLLLALDYKLKRFNQLMQNKRGFLAFFLVFIFLAVFMCTLSTVALFISPWLGPGQRVTIMILEFIPSLAAFGFLIYVAIKMLGWPDRVESDIGKSQAQDETQSDK